MIDTTNQVGSAVADPTILTEETYNTLCKMLRSNDEGDHKMAQVILTQLNVEKSIWWIYKLTKAGYTARMVNLRTKLGRKFRDESSLFSISSMSEFGFAKWCNRKGWLTPEIFMNCKKSIIQAIKNSVSDNPFFTIDIELKEEFKPLDPSDTIQKIK